MEFWGVEVKSGISLDLDPGEDMILHISQMSLGENKNNEKEPIRIYLKIGGQKLIIGTLSHEKFPQLATEIVLEKGFQLSHSWKHGSVFFTGYRVDASDPDEDDMDEDASEVAAPETRPAAAAAVAKQVNFKLPTEEGKAEEDESESDDEDSSDDESDEESGEEEEKKVTAEVDNKEDDDEDDSSDSDDEDDDSSEDEEDTPKKPEESKKRSSAEPNTSKDSTSNKKAKFVTPQKTETKKPPHVHVATPHPAKGKNSGSNGEASKTPKSVGGGSFGCKSCDRKFGSEMGLQSHTKAKHSAAA